MVQTVVRAWMWIAISRTRPENLPEDWRDKPELFAKCMLGIRNARLGVLMRMQRYASGKQSVSSLDRVRRQEEKLTKVDKMRQSALLTTVKTLDMGELGSSLVAGTAEIGVALVKDSTSLVKDSTSLVKGGLMTVSSDGGARAKSAGGGGEGSTFEIE
jgi:hypothetical protein|eukprot:COSAG06_NODE_130_length_22547_cov_24.796418_8_plen_158_part_00